MTVAEYDILEYQSLNSKGAMTRKKAYITVDNTGTKDIVWSERRGGFWSNEKPEVDQLVKLFITNKKGWICGAVSTPGEFVEVLNKVKDELKDIMKKAPDLIQVKAEVV